ncbi:chaperonin GroEL [Candidatus Vidania fulgoroideorum]
MRRKVILGSKLMPKVIKGINLISKAVSITLGPRGKNVILERKFGTPIITKDGVTVAREIELKDKVENIGAQLIREVALKTNETSGDGTTTATVLSHSIIKNGIKYIALGIDPMKVKKEIEFYMKLISKKLNKNSKKISNIKEIRSVGTVSSNNDSKIGKMIAKAISKVGKEGIITIEEGKSTKDELLVVNGLQFDKGYASPYFLSDQDKEKIILDEPFILLCEDNISNIRDLVPILEEISKASKPVLLVTDDIESEVLNTIILNSIRGIIKIVVVKSPSFGDKRKNIINDISLLTRAKLVSKKLGVSLRKIKIKDLGKAKKVIILKDETIIFSNNKNNANIVKRINVLKKRIKNTDSEFDKEKIKERISKLSGGVAVIRVGGNSEVEVKERKYRIEDSLNATKAAIEEGILPGGGLALLRISEWLNNKFKKNCSKRIGLDIITSSITEPFKQILKNGGIEPGLVLNEIKNKGNYGYDLSDNSYCDLVKKGIIDPTKVIRMAVQNAISVSALVLTLGCVVTNSERIKPSL